MRLFNELPPFEAQVDVSRAGGLQTADDFRFVRTWWEARRQHCSSASWLSRSPREARFVRIYADLHSCFVELADEGRS